MDRGGGLRNGRQLRHLLKLVGRRTLDRCGYMIMLRMLDRLVRLLVRNWNRCLTPFSDQIILGRVARLAWG